MNYLIEDEVPEYWESIFDSFITMVQWEEEFNNGPSVDCVEARVHKGLLHIIYEGGDRTTDALARFAREHSSKVCFACGAPASRVVFQYPKCDECD